jgi:hypothetical protein
MVGVVGWVFREIVALEARGAYTGGMVRQTFALSVSSCLMDSPSHGAMSDLQ